MDQKEGIKVKFSEGLGIFDDHYGYPVIDEQEIYNGTTGKVKDIQGPQAHAGRNFFVPEGNEFIIDIDECPYFHIAIKAGEGTNTCLLLCVRDKKPREHVWRHVVIGKTIEGDPGIYDVIKDCFEIKDDNQWHEYDLDLRKIREKQDDKYPYYPDAGGVSVIQFYSWTGSGEHTFHFNDLFLMVKVPVKVDEIELAKMQRIGKISGFTNARIALLLSKGHTISTLTDKALQDMVAAKDMKDQDARKLGLTVSLYNLFDGNLNAIETMKKGGLPQPRGRKFETLRDLAAFDAAEWLTILRKAKIKLPDKKTIENYAESLSIKMASLYPTDAFFGGLTPVKRADISKCIKRVAPLFNGNYKVFSIPGLERINVNKAESPETENLKSIFKRFFPLDQEPSLKNRSSLQKEFMIASGTSIFDRLNNKRMEQSEIEAIHTTYTQLKRFVNQYPGLGLGDILDDPKLPPADKIAKITERIDLLNRVWEQNPDVEVLKLDYSPNSIDMTVLNLKDYSALEQAMVLSTLKAYQRAFILTGDVGHARTILESGYTSSTGIVNGGFETFVLSTGFSPEVARTHFDTARKMTVTVGAGLGTILDYMWGGFNWLNVSNIKHSSTKTLESGTFNRLDDFEALFGNQTYCKCQHCQSILSPAAYFVDLMNFLDTNLPAAMQQLQFRRPDLWRVELTCDNTNTKIPTLEVVNEILENYILNIFSHLEMGKVVFVLTDASLQELRDSGVPETVLQQLENIKEQKFYIYSSFFLMVKKQLGADYSKYINRICEVASNAINIPTEMFVFQVINEISKSICSFQRPFALQIEKLQSYLELFDLTRAKVACEIEADHEVLARTTLNLSMEEHALVTQANPTLNFLTVLYNIRFIFESGTDKILPFDVQDILSPMNLSRSDLGELIKTRFVSGGIQIIPMKRSQDSVQNDIEMINNLTLEVLDRMHRFTRLWRRLLPIDEAPDGPRWTMAELDLVLYLLGGTGFSPRNIDIENLVTILSLQERWGMSVARVCGMWCDDLNEIMLAGQKASTSLLDQLFNLPSFNQANTPFPRDNSLFVHPAFMQSGGSSSTDNALHRLHAGLQVNDEELYQLIVHLGNALRIKPSTKSSEVGFYLTAHNITLLYRHARLAKSLNLTIQELFQLIKFTIPNGVIDNANTSDANLSNLADIAELLEFYDWLQASGYKLEDLAFVTGGSYKPEAYPDSIKLVQQIVEKVQADKALEFADTVFAFLEDVTEKQSRQIIAANSDPNANIIEAVNPEKTIYRLANTFTSSTTLNIPPDVTTAVAQLKNMTDINAVETILQTETLAVLLNYHASKVIPAHLATLVNLSVDKLMSFIAWNKEDLFEPVLSQILLGEIIYEEPIKDPSNKKQGDTTLIIPWPWENPLVKLVYRVLRLSIIFSNQVFDPETLNFIYNQQNIFINSKSRGFIEPQLSVYTVLADRAARERSSPVNKSAISSAKVSQLLFDLHTWLPLAPEDPAKTTKLAQLAQALAGVLHVEIGLATALLNNVPLPGNAPEALLRLARCATLAARLGVGGETLPLIISDNCDKLDLAYDAILGALRAKHPDEENWLVPVNPIEDKLRAQKRDTLCDFLMQLSRMGAFGEHELKTMHDLYQYFLIDVELEGCARTSRVVAAISSIQLYIHRILMNMESVTLTQERALEWEWRKNYRVWEANRKVFLYPENYIEPDLRDDKTPLFRDLESKLLQQQINQQNVLDVYSSYMSGFEEVARLKIAGSFHDIGSDEDTLHLFGVTQDNPPIYYYRAVNNAYWCEKEKKRGIDWSHWRKVDVQIPVPKVAPVVYNGRLYVFWVEITSTPKNTVSNGESRFTGYKHKMTLKYTTLRLDGTWTAPQMISLNDKTYFPMGDGTINDPLLDDKEQQKLQDLQLKLQVAIATSDISSPNSIEVCAKKLLEFTLDKMVTPKYDPEHKHFEPKDGYTLTGFQWNQVYPVVIKDELIVTGRNFLMRGAIDFYKKAIIPTKYDKGTALINMVPCLHPPLLFPKAPIAGSQWSRWSGRTLIPMHDGRLLVWKSDGSWELFDYDKNNIDDIFPGKPVAKNQFQSMADHTLIPMHDGRVLDWQGDGKWKLWEYDPTNYDNFIPVKVAENRWSTIVTGHTLIPMHDGRVLDWNKGEGEWVLWEYDPLKTHDILELDVARGNWKYRIGHTLIPMPDGKVLDWKEGESTWQLFNYDPTNIDDIFPGYPVAEGKWEFENFGGKWVCKIGSTIIPLPDGRVFYWNRTNGNWRLLNYGTSTLLSYAETSLPFDSYASYSIYSCWENITSVRIFPDQKIPISYYDKCTDISRLDVPAELAVINGSLQDCIIDIQGDLFLLQHSVFQNGTSPLCSFKRLGTTLSEMLIKKLFTGGVNLLLSIETQKNYLHEKKHPFDVLKHPWNNVDYIKIDTGTNQSIEKQFDFRHGPYGVYYREIFFHIPFLIANHLNSQGRFADAQRWYHYIFDPTARESTSLPQDRNWRYLDFRSQSETIRDILTPPDKEVIEVYKKDPFNPHAIARLRLTSYQKSIVMKYIDNLLDWGDSLFAQYTMESVNEATMLYIMAADILGERPAELGECGEGSLKPKNYTTIKPLLKQGEFLQEFPAELETRALSRTYLLQSKTKPANAYILEGTVSFAIKSAGLSHVAGGENGMVREGIFKAFDWKKEPMGSGSKQMGVNDSPLIQNPDLIPDFSSSLIRMVCSRAGNLIEGKKPILSPLFCIPVNTDLLGCWDRVEDRLYKIRHCLDINGVRRDLNLFAPEINPRLLVQIKAAGLTLEDVLGASSGNLPPYRFAFLIEKAKQYASTVQSFGSALLSAIEKKDIEQLNNLRTVHEQNIQQLTRQIKQSEIDAETQSLQALERQKESVTYRKGYYQGLVEQGLIQWERTQQISQHSASIIRILEANTNLMSAIAFLIPQLGSPFAMKYGGQEIGSSGKAFAVASGAMADIASSIAASAGLEATFKRREQDWKHQIELANLELKQIDRQIAATTIRQQIANQSLDIHDKNIEQTKEIYDFYSHKFSNYGLYTWLSTTLQTVYRDAYNCAFAMAQLAEQGYRFERDDDKTNLLGLGYWEASHAGLLSGERLLIALQNMERRFIETNYRTFEIEQSFSLAQIKPEALVELREKGSCESFVISEWFYDLYYPGQYRRMIKAVRVTIPCVTGPYTNVGATLRLMSSKIRTEANTSDSSLKEVPLQRSVCIAISKAQNDAGVFELNYHDERYMPFEGAGAVDSNWKLELPSKLRSFDYSTISDIILHISYTAKDGGDSFKKDVENKIISDLTKNELYRLLSLKHEFPNALYKLLHPTGAAQNTDFELDKQHFPYFLIDKSLTLSTLKVYLSPKDSKSITTDGLELGINDGSMNNWINLDNGIIVGEIKLTGNPIRNWTIAANTGSLSRDELDDIFILLGYKVSP